MAGQWASGIILSLILPITGFCAWFLCRFWGSKLRSSCLLSCEAGTLLTEPTPHPLLCIFWDGLLVNLEFGRQTLYQPSHCSSPWILFFLYCSGWIPSLAHCMQALSGLPSELFRLSLTMQLSLTLNFLLVYTGFEFVIFNGYRCVLQGRSWFLFYPKSQC